MNFLKEIWKSVSGDNKKAQSKAKSVDVSDIADWLVNAGIIGAVASVTYLMDNSAELGLGSFAPVVVVIGGSIVNFLYKFMKNNDKKEE